MAIETTRYLVIGLDALGVGIAQNGDVVVSLAGLGQQIDLAPGLEVMVGLSPEQARELAERLDSKAREAEGGSSQH